MWLSALHFAHPEWFWALGLIPVLAGLFFHAETQAARKLERLMRSPRLRAQLTGAASAGRRRGRFALMLLGLACLVLTMTMPRWGYEAQPVRRKGLDLIFIVDVSKSMLATDLPPNRLTRAKLAATDLLALLEGDRAGLIAFAGTAFLQAPLTIDYDAVLTALNDLDTDTIPRGGTNLEGAIDLALNAFGKAEADNRAIVLFSDGESTAGEGTNGLQAAARAAEAGVKIFTVGMGTAEGSFIPLPGTNAQFVRDRDGKIVRSKLDADNLDKIAKAANGFYLPLEQNGQAEMRTLVQDGLRKVKTGEIDARQSSRPIERYQWPLGAALLSLGLSALIGERRKARAPAPGRVRPRAVPMGRQSTPAAVSAAVLALFICLCANELSAAESDPMKLYNNGRYAEAYQAFKDLAQKNPDAAKLQFDAGASAYQDGKYEDALNAFGQAMTVNNPALQAMSHYNFGNSLFRRGESQKNRETKIKDWQNAIEHYNNTLNLLKSNPNDALAQDTTYNRDLVQKLLAEEMKPKPTPLPQQQKDQQKQNKSNQKQQQQQQQKQDQQKQQDQNKQDQKDQQNSQQQGDQQQQQQSGQQKQQQQSQSDQNGSSQSQEDKSSQSNQPPKPDPSGQSKDQQKQENAPPQGGKSGQQNQQPQSGKDQNPDNQPPQPGQDSQANDKPAPAPNQDQPRQRGDFKAQPQSGDQPKDQGEKGDQPAQQTSEQEPPEEKGKMSAAQARALLDALKNEDSKVDLSDRRDRREEPAFDDW